ncbi:MAG: HAD-IC family P-type ATPase [Parcubacteria group bacterium]|nr:HAD-IC family P-type ATPase [Parcubacteria group bacterium]
MPTKHKKTSYWYRLPLTDVLYKLGVNPTEGLTLSETEKRFNTHGPNTFADSGAHSLFRTVLTQFKNPLVFVLLGAALATIILHEYIDLIVIIAALLINVIIGTLQEERAYGAFKKLKDSQEKEAHVLRAGKRHIIPADRLVPGDICILETGMYVPADVRLAAVTDFAVNESALTGEWMEVVKEIKDMPEERSITERGNMAWMGTLVVSGNAVGVVVGTGEDTQIGRIAAELGEATEHATPLQKNIKHLATQLTFAIAGALVVIIAIGLFRGESWGEMLLVGIAIAVAAMPEGLPAAVTVVLALGMENILKKKGLVRNLLAAETLGSTTVILTDKTGTLTQADMRIAAIITPGSFDTEKKDAKDIHVASDDGDERDVLAMAMLTSDAFVEGYDDTLSTWNVHGRPVERAIVLAGVESGEQPDSLFAKYPKRDSIPFESERKYSATLHSLPKGKRRAYMTGAPEVLLGDATHVYVQGKKKKLTRSLRELLEKRQEQESAKGLRLIGVAYKDVNWDTFPKEAFSNPAFLLKETVFAGFLIIHDPVREDVAASIKDARAAGARIIMLTGDNENTARRIAIEVGITNMSRTALTGADIAKLSDTELRTALKTTDVFARVLPHQKMRVVRIMKEDGEVVAMTGDGINDAPALRRADIGVALGSGTEVAKEASDLILLDNSFTTIVHAIKEGRRILDNMRKIVAYLLSTGFSEIIIVGTALFIGLPIPILPTQILWTNIVSEGFMNFAFAFEPTEKEAMKQNPRSVERKKIITPHIRTLIIILSMVTGVFLILLYLFLLASDFPLEKIRTIMFTALSFGAILFSFSLKNLHRPLWYIHLGNNPHLLFALFASFGTLVLALTVPFLQTLLSLVPLSLLDILFAIIIGVLNIICIESVKYFVFMRGKTNYK